MQTADLLGLDACRVWNTERAFEHLRATGHADTRRTAERRLQALAFLPPELKENGLEDNTGRPPGTQVLQWAMSRARAKRQRVLFAQLKALPNGRDCLHLNDARGGRYWIPLPVPIADSETVSAALCDLQHDLDKPLTVFPHGRLVPLMHRMTAPEHVSLCLLGYPPMPSQYDRPARRVSITPPHLRRLEAESIYILREAVAEAEANAGNPVMLYSAGKDSSVMLHLARKAFFPARPPFPLLHVDTRWKFQEMYLFRDQMAEACGMDLLVHINPDAIARDINPFDHGSALHTDITKTEGLKQALDHFGFDLVFGGARRDEEKSRAKERIFSFRNQNHCWDPKNQRPELWNLFNTHKRSGESVRVFPLSNWTELDIWQYIHHEALPVVPLYFAKNRPVVERDGMLIMVDDDRFRLLPGETIQERQVRFRTLGCYPLTGAIESSARSVAEIILELLETRYSERQGRAIDKDAGASMEKKKQEGYF